MRPTRNALLETLNAPSRALLTAAEDAAGAVNARLWLVGGGTRDLAVRRPLHDLDLAFAADARTLIDALSARLPDAHIERTDRFGTAGVAYGGARMDVARLRTENYVTPGALPDVRPTDRIDLDLARRDFTVNAIALGLVGPDADEIVDPFEGLADLAAHRLRVLHERSFVDDASRLWRGARTAALFDLEPDAATSRLIAEGGRWLEEISGDRLWAELSATAARGKALQTLERLDAWRVLAAVHAGFRLTSSSRAALTRRRQMPVERLAAVVTAPLPQRARGGLLARFNASREARTVVADTVRLIEAPDATLDTIEALDGVHSEARIAASWLATGAQDDLQHDLQRALRRWERTRPHLSAGELVELGIPRGAGLGVALRELRRARYLGTLRTATDARALTRRVVAGETTWDATSAPRRRRPQAERTEAHASRRKARQRKRQED